MPELPDVEVAKRYLDATALHQPIEAVRLLAPGMLDGVSPRTLRRRLTGRALRRTRRHGKHLFVHLEGDGWLRLHFGMTGALDYRRDDRAESPRARLVLALATGYRLAYLSRRKLGRVGLVEDVDAWIRERGLGPDALAPALDLPRIAAGRRGGVKSLLMDQRAIAGLGNVYSDEILFQAGIDPRSPLAHLDARGLRRLERSLADVLRAAIRAKADPRAMPAWFLLPHREPGARCPRCGGRIERIRLGGRSAYLCPGHQRCRGRRAGH